MTPLLLASGNRGKLAEIQALLQLRPELAGIYLITPGDLSLPLPEVEESGATFLENARMKAHAWAQASGYAVIADDSGLCVDALGGAPGVRSARWAGPDATDGERNGLLLQRLSGVPQEERTARFACAVVAASPAGHEAIGEGACEGLIAPAPRGANGFGYDPVFLLPGLGRTMAELSSEEKNSISHRRQALWALLPNLSELLLKRE